MITEIISAKLLFFAFLGYVAATCLFILEPILKKNSLRILGLISFYLGFALHTAGLGFRWHAGGIHHPPWTNLYESLIFFIWGIVAVYVYFDRKYKIPFAGLITSVFVVIAMGLASLSPNKEVESLVPALQSWWLHIHVFFASIGYAFFMSSAVFAILFVIKNKTPLANLQFAFNTFALFCIILVGKSSILLLKPFTFNKVELMHDKLISTDTLIPVAGLNFLFLLITITLTGTILLSFKNGKLSGLLSDLSFALYLIITAWFFWAFFSVEGISPVSNPYSLSVLFLGVGGLIIFNLVKWKQEFFHNYLPSEDVLDQLGYKAILIGFPLLTLVIVTGAVWADYAWGRYWGWDPKETWSLITWFIYALYLHLRFQRGWKGGKIALMSIFGFIAVIFTYLGVNILLSGLHSYGQG